MNLNLKPDEEFVLIQFIEEGILNSYIGNVSFNSNIYGSMLSELELINTSYYRALSPESKKVVNDLESRWFWRFYRRLDNENGGPADYDRPPFIVGAYW